MPHLGLPAALAVVFTVVLAGCGSSSSSNDEASKSADQIFADTVAAMKQVEHVHLTGTQTDDTGTAQISADVTQNAARIDVKQGGTDTIIIVVGGKAYGEQNGGNFQELPSDVELEAQATTLAKTIECAQKERGTLTKGDVTSVKGVRVIAIKDDGKVAGGSPGTTYVALDGPQRVIETRQEGKNTPGGSADCGHTPSSTTSAGMVDYDYAASVSTITMPPSGAGA